MGSLRRFLASRADLHGIGAQIPGLSPKIDLTLQTCLDAMSPELAVDDVDDAAAKRDLERERVERGPANSHVAGDVDRPPLAPTQGLLEIDPGNRALLQPQRDRAA